MGRYEPDEADALIADGVADFVAMGRKLLADPDLPRKLTDAHREHPPVHLPVPLHRQHLRGRAAALRRQRVRAGSTTWGWRRRGTRSVLVVGGGPAGLGVARTLAARTR